MLECLLLGDILYCFFFRRSFRMCIVCSCCRQCAKKRYPSFGIFLPAYARSQMNRPEQNKRSEKACFGRPVASGSAERSVENHPDVSSRCCHVELATSRPLGRGTSLSRLLWSLDIPYFSPSRSLSHSLSLSLPPSPSLTFFSIIISDK